MSNLKVEASRAALAHVQSGMTVGLGTGSTAAEFVKLLGAAVQSGALRDLRCTSTSEETERLARDLGIAMFRLADVAPLDIAIDGADEIDARLRLVKGRGGALLREKIVEQQARRFIVIADESKIVHRLGAGPFPVEVTPFAREVLEKRFTEMGIEPKLRVKNGATLVTDEGNVIFDVRVPQSRDIADLVDDLKMLAGVVETGFFPTEATDAVIAASSGIRWMHR